MAGNKYNPPPMGYKPEKVEVRYTGRYGDSNLAKGPVKQMIKHLLELL